MNIKSKHWDSLRTSLWFIPSLMVVSAIALSFLTIALDEGDREWLKTFGWTYTRGADGARAILSSVAGSMITVATTAFSIVIVALQLASGQFGPRLLRQFMRDTGNQIVLGTFIATFIYCLLVLRTINAGEDNEFVPHLSVTFALALALASIAVLIYFIHHAAESIQAQHVIAQVGDELNQTIDNLFPKKIGHSVPNHNQIDIPANFEREANPIRASRSGYIQVIDDDELMKIATQSNILVRLNHRPGDFMVQGSDLAIVYPGERVNQKLDKKINSAFSFGKQRTQQQNVKFSIDQLVEIAIRALSPGINDPFTAIQCIDGLSVGLCHLAEREIPSPYRYDEDNKLRVIAYPVTFAEMTDAAFNQIRQYGQSSVAVIIRLLEAIALIATHTHNNTDRASLLRHAQMIERASHEQVSEELDKKDIEKQYQAAVRAIEYR